MIVCLVLIGLVGITVANVNQQKRNGRTVFAQQAIQLSDVEKENILYMRQEEKLARDVYITLYELWDAEIFANISESEQRHMNAIKNLITIYGLQDPVEDDTVGQFSNPVFSDYYEQFVAKAVTLVDALNVGVEIEQLDISDLTEALTETTKKNITRVFNNLLNGSLKHLAAFQNCIEADDVNCTPGTNCNCRCSSCLSK